MQFDPAVALDYARLIAQPRRVGTAANDAMINELADRLRSFGCAVDVVPFGLSSPGDAAIVFFVLAAQILVLITFWSWSFSAWIAVVPALALAGLLLSSGRIYRAAALASLLPEDLTHITRLRRWWLARGQPYRTANIVAHAPARAGASAHTPLLLVAHSDSKSQAMSLVARMSLAGLATGSAILFTLLTVARPLANWLTSAAAVAGLLAVASGVPLLFMLLAGSGNASPGAIDNASGAGLVLHLAECLCANPPLRPVTVLITGAEELGLLGSLTYVRDTGARILKNTQVLNFDGIGTAGQLAVVGGGGRALERAVRGACRDLNIRLGRLPLVGAQFDHLPFVDAGVDALSLVTLGRAALSVHTPNDDVSRLDIEGFRQAGQVALRVVAKFD